MKPTGNPPSRPLTLDIVDVAFGGDGVGRGEGGVVFVPFTLDGERVRARLTERKTRFARGDLVELLTRSPYRVTPPCPVFGRCGGCAYQHVAYARQLEIKRAQVEGTLRRLGGLRDVRVAQTVPSPLTFGYRSRVTVHASEDGGAVGYYRARSREVLDVERCPIASDAVNARLAELRRTGLRPGAHRTLRDDDAGPTFEQVNRAVALALREYVGAALQGDRLIDAYCGTGFFAHAFAPRLRATVGLEWSAPAVRRARETAGPNEEYREGDVGDLLGAALSELSPGTLLLDPPAEGLSSAVSDAVLARPPRRVIYVSCNPATLARDLARLLAGGRYQLGPVQPFDMFPQTAEIEAVAILDRTEGEVSGSEL